MEFDPVKDLIHVLRLQMQSTLRRLLVECAGIRSTDEPVASRRSSSSYVRQIQHREPGKGDLANGALDFLEPEALLLITPETGRRG